MGLCAENGATLSRWEYGDEKTRINQLNEKRSLIPQGFKAPIWKIYCCSSVLRLSELPRERLRGRERPQTAICCLESLGRLKCPTTALDASLSFLSTSRRCSRNLSPSRLFAISVSYAVNDIGGGARKVISDLNGSLESRHFLYVMNKRTSFASWASAFEIKFQLGHWFEMNF